MLIKALNDYYDCLAADGKINPQGYSQVKISYLVLLRSDGTIAGISSRKKRVKSGKKEVEIPEQFLMPKRSEKTALDVNYPEHRPLYLFGIGCEKGDKKKNTPPHLTAADTKAQKSHKLFVERTLEFLQGLDSPVINAFRNFVQNWQPEKEAENPILQGIIKDYATAGFVFALDGSPDQKLHDDRQLKAKWDKYFNSRPSGETGQCSVTGNIEPIAKVHSVIKGLKGGSPTGCSLVNFNNESDCSYGKAQSYNSSISETAMTKYTEALNCLLSDKSHLCCIDDITIVYWSASSHNKNNECFNSLLEGFDDQSELNQSDTGSMLDAVIKDAADSGITDERLKNLGIDPSVDFYIVCLKPNVSRIAVKFIYKNKFGEIFRNIVRHQQDICVRTDKKPVRLWQIRQQMIPPRATNKNIEAPSDLIISLFHSICCGSRYPVWLLETMVRRVRTDSTISADDQKKLKNKVCNFIRVGLIKGFINRYTQSEEIQVSLDESNARPAYVCGRLFAVLERLQQAASKTTLNRTIKDAYFSETCAKPAVMFPRIMILAQHHLKKIDSDGLRIYFDKMIQAIVSMLDGGFPDLLTLADQGRFIVGYYQQKEALYKAKDKEQSQETAQ